MRTDLIELPDISSELSDRECIRIVFFKLPGSRLRILLKDMIVEVVDWGVEVTRDCIPRPRSPRPALAGMDLSVFPEFLR